MAYDKSDLQEIQADVLTSDLTENPYISKLKQLKTDNKTPTKAINAVFELLGNAQESAADALQRVVVAEESLDSVEQSLGNMEQSLDSVTTRVDTLESCNCGGVTRGNVVSEPTAVGVITWQHVLLADHLVLDGQTVTASAYPELLRFVTTHQLTVSAEEYATNCALYVYDLTADTLILPNLMNRTLWGASAPASIEAGLPNITGEILSHSFSDLESDGAVARGRGAFEKHDDQQALWSRLTVSGLATPKRISFDASRSSTAYGASETVQPPAVGLIPQVRVKPLTVTGTQADDGTPVGRVVFDSFLREGYIKANGAAVADASTAVPRLVTLVHDHPELLGDDAVHYAYDETTDTLTMPNYIGLVPQGGESVNHVEAGLPNIRSMLQYIVSLGGIPNSAINENNALTWSTRYTAALTACDMSSAANIVFDASKSNPIYGSSTTVQPPAVTFIPQIRY